MFYNQAALDAISGVPALTSVRTLLLVTRHVELATRAGHKAQIVRRLKDAGLPDYKL